MVTIPLYTILFLYFALVLVILALLFVNFFHLVHTGTFTLTSFVVTFAVLAAAAITFWATWYLLQDVFWQAPVTVWNSAWFGNALSNNIIANQLPK